MSTTSVTENIVQTILANTDVKPSNPKKDDNYRYYHCSLDWDGLKCKPVSNSSILPTKENTKLLFVKSYFPEKLDSIVLKYKWMPDRVVIENKST